MKPTPDHLAPPDASQRSDVPVVVCYPPETIPPLDAKVVAAAKRLDDQGG